MTTVQVFGRVEVAMRDTHTPDLRVNQIVQYTDPDGKAHDAIVHMIDHESVTIRYRPRIVERFRMVDRLTLEIPE